MRVILGVFLGLAVLAMGCKTTQSGELSAGAAGPLQACQDTKNESDNLKKQRKFEEAMRLQEAVASLVRKNDKSSLKEAAALTLFAMITGVNTEEAMKMLGITLNGEQFSSVEYNKLVADILRATPDASGRVDAKAAASIVDVFAQILSNAKKDIASAKSAAEKADFATGMLGSALAAASAAKMMDGASKSAIIDISGAFLRTAAELDRTAVTDRNNFVKSLAGVDGITQEALADLTAASARTSAEAGGANIKMEAALRLAEGMLEGANMERVRQEARSLGVDAATLSKAEAELRKVIPERGEIDPAKVHRGVAEALGRGFGLGVDAKLVERTRARAEMSSRRIGAVRG